MLQNTSVNDWLNLVKTKSTNIMQTLAEKKLNPHRYHLSLEAKKRLGWLYLIYQEKRSISKAARKAGLSRQWLSHLKQVFEGNNKDPRSLEPKSRAPNCTLNRQRISEKAEKLIIKIRDDSLNSWGKEKIAVVLKRDYGIKVNPNTVNKYLHKHKRICPKISLKNIKAFESKKKRESEGAILRAKFRPPSKLKDYAPGALVEKDMKYVLKAGKGGDSKQDFWFQHTTIDSFTRIRTLELTNSSDSADAAVAYDNAKVRFPFEIACANTDNGSENKKEFSEKLQKDKVFHFYSNAGTPTDNPRVERSHLSDDLEFYNKKDIYKDFQEQKTSLGRWEHLWNNERPHQALGYLTPMAFYQLWKEDPGQAYKIVEKWQSYLKKQSKRQAQSRKIKRKDQIEALMKFIDAKLNKNKGLNKAKLQLINCQLCSVA